MAFAFPRQAVYKLRENVYKKQRASGTNRPRTPVRCPVAWQLGIRCAATADVLAADAVIIDQQQTTNERNGRAITVGDKPAANSLLRRLQEAPQAVVRAYSTSDKHTYKTLATIAAAQSQLQPTGKALVYIPFTKSKTYTAVVLPASNNNQLSSSDKSEKLLVKGSTNANDLANTLVFKLVKNGSAVLWSAGAAATAKAAAALVKAREQLLKKAYELGVQPHFVDNAGQDGMVTVLSQKVILRELPPATVTLPQSDSKPTDYAAAAARIMLQKQQRVQLVLEPQQLGRLTGLLHQVTQPAAAADLADDDNSDGEQPSSSLNQQGKKRLLLMWLSGTQGSDTNTRQQLNQAAGDVSTLLPLAANSQEPQLQLQLRRSRFTIIPPLQQGSHSGSGRKQDSQPVNVTAKSSVTGVAGAIEAKVSRTGIALLVTDGSVQGNASAWHAVIGAGQKMDAFDGKGSLIVLLDVQQQQGRQQQGQQQQKEQQQDESARGQRLRMLLVRNSEVARSILQAPNTPLELSGSVDLWPIISFAAAANTFLPKSAASGSGGLVLLPAVLSIPEPSQAAAAGALDYRFIDYAQQQMPYAIRLQRFQGQLSQFDQADWLKVSATTDVKKLRDAIVARVLQQQSAGIRLVGQVGRGSPLLTTAVAAVASSRVRLQQKDAGMDVGVMPFIEQAPELEQGGENAGSTSGSSNQALVLYSFRLIPLPQSPAVSQAATAAAPLQVS